MSFAARAAVPVSTSAWSTGFVTSDSSYLHSSPSWQRAWGRLSQITTDIHGGADREGRRPLRHVARATACNSVDGLSWIGSVKWNSDPCPTVLSNQMRPPCISTI